MLCSETFLVIPARSLRRNIMMWMLYNQVKLSFQRGSRSLSESPTQTTDSSPCCKTGPSSGPPKWKCLAPPLLTTISIITEIRYLKNLVGSCTDFNIDSGLNLKYWLRLQPKMQTTAESTLAPWSSLLCHLCSTEMSKLWNFSVRIQFLIR